MTRHATDSEVPATSYGWWPESISDGGGHYGQCDGDGLVRAVCGLVFEPLPNPYTHQVMRHFTPADKEHACRDCLANNAPWHV